MLLAQKLLKIAQNQQKILEKLAQTAPPTNQMEDVEGTKKYLSSVWQTAGLNAGVVQMSNPFVTYTPGSKSESGAMMEGGYMVRGPIPAAQRQKFQDTFNRQLQTQKPELQGRVSTMFDDPTQTPST